MSHRRMFQRVRGVPRLDSSKPVESLPEDTQKSVAGLLVFGLLLLVSSLVLGGPSGASRGAAPDSALVTPSESSTGVPQGVVLAQSGSVVVKTEGTVIDALEIDGSINVKADNVTIRNSRINAGGNIYGVKLQSGVSGLRIVDTEIFGARSAAVSYGQYEALRLDVHDSRDGLLIGSGTEVRDSWIHDLQSGAEGIKSVGGSDVVIAGNHIVVPTDSGGAALELYASRAPLADWLIEGNLLEGGRNTFRLRERGFEASGLRLINNTWVLDSWGQSPVRSSGGAGEWSGNRFSDGSPVPAPFGGVGPDLPSPGPSVPMLPLPAPPVTSGAPTTTESAPTTSPDSRPDTSVPAPDAPGPAPTTTAGPSTTTAPSTTVAPSTSAAPPLPVPTPTTVTPAPPPGPSVCGFTNPNQPQDDPNPVYNGTRGRFPVSPNPIPSGYPTPLTTGICGTGLTSSDLQPSGGLTITENGAVIDGLDISGSVSVKADNVTIRNSQITSTGRYTVHLENGFTGLTVEDTRIRAVGESASTAVYLKGYATFRRVHITGGADVMKAEKGVLVEQSYLGATYRKPGSHNDVVQIRTGSNYKFLNNTLLGPWDQTTSVFLFQAKAGAGGGPIDDVLVEGNYMSGGGYTIYTEAPDYSLTNGIVRNNRIELDSWKFGWKRNGAGATYSGNVQLPS